MRENVPAMDRPSIMFARLLDNIVVEEVDDTLGLPGDTELVLNCRACIEQVCQVEDGDTIRVLLNTALAHVCGA